MPHISDFSKALDLPIPQPVTVAQVKQFGCSPRADHVGGRVVLTNGYSFTFDLGAVVLYRSPHSYYSLQDPNQLPEFYGPVNVGKDEAVKIAREALKKLGYTDSELHFNQPPKVTPPKRNEGKQIARYFVEWIDTKQVSAGGIPLERTAIEVDASTGRIEMLGIQAKQSQRPDPKIGIHPTVLTAVPKSELVGGTPVFRVNHDYAQAFLFAIMPQLSDFVEKSGATVKIPITTNDIDMEHYDFGLVAGNPRACVYLKTKDRFWYEHGQVIEFNASDADNWPAPGRASEDKPHDQFYGPVNMAPKEAVNLVRQIINQLGYTRQIPQLKREPEIVLPRKEGTNYFARYFFNWWPTDEGVQNVSVEMDATTKKLKSFYINDRANPQIWRDPPKITLPLTVATNVSTQNLSGRTTQNDNSGR